MASSDVAAASPGLTCDAICSAVLPCVALIRLMKCVKFCRRIPVHGDLDNTHVKHLAAVFLATCGRSVDGISMKTQRGIVGEKRTYTCPRGFEFCYRTLKPPKISCQSDGRWSDPPVPCHQKRWRRFMNWQNVSLQFTCSVKRDSRISIRTSLTKLRAEVRVSLRGPVGILDFTFTVEPHMLSIVQLEYKAFKGKWRKYQNRKERLRFRTNSAIFHLLFVHLGSYMQVWLGGNKITSYVIPRDMAFTQLSFTGHVTTKDVNIFRNYNPRKKKKT